MGSLLKPMNEARIWLSRSDKARKRGDELSRRRVALWEASRMQDHDAMVRALTTSIFAIESKEVLAVVGDDRALELLCMGE